MTTLSKTLIAATAFAAIATSAFSQAPMEFKSGMAHVYVGGKMSGITLAPGERNHEAMMKNATKVPNNTVFFMNNGQLYSTSGMLDPTGNFYIPWSSAFNTSGPPLAGGPDWKIVSSGECRSTP